MRKVVGDRMNHSDFVLKARHLIKTCKVLDVVCVCFRDSQDNLSVFGDHRIGTEPAIARKIEHVGWFGEEKNVDSFFSHHFGTPLHTPAINTVIHVDLLVMLMVVPLSCGYKEIA